MRPNSQETAELVTYTEEILNRILHFLCNVITAANSMNEWELINLYKF